MIRRSLLGREGAYGLIATFNVTSTTEPTQIMTINTNAIDKLKIDGIVTERTRTYTFDTIGEHTVKYAFTNRNEIPERLLDRNSGITSVVIKNFITAIGASAFSYSTVDSVVFEQNSELTTIGDWSFNMAKKLTSIDIPSGVTTIGEDAFYNCYQLTSVTFVQGSQLDSIGDKAFFHCSGLTNFDIPASVTSIGGSAFTNCDGFIVINIPSGVTEIKPETFSSCSNLERVNSNTVGECKITDNITIVGDFAFEYCPRFTKLTVGSGTTNIGDNPWAYCHGITSITVDGHNTSYESYCNAIYTYDRLRVGCTGTYNVENHYTRNISYYAFRGSHISSIDLPTSLTGIGAYSFADCIYLTDITIPDNVGYIYYSGFRNCNRLSACTISQNSKLVYFGNNAFYGCDSLASFYIPSGMTDIGSYSFARCPSLTSLTVDSGNAVYDSRNNCNAIIETSTDKLVVASNNTIIPNSVISIGSYAFSGRRGTTLNIPEGVTSVASSGFEYCNYTSIIFPTTITSLGSCALYQSQVDSLRFYATTAPTIYTGNENLCTFLNIKKNGTLYYPSGASGYSAWMGTTKRWYLGYYNWTSSTF